MDRANARTAQLTQEQYWAMATLEGEIRTGLEAAVRSGADPAGDGGLDLACGTKPGFPTPGRSAGTALKHTGCWPPCIPRTSGSPPIMTVRSPAARPFLRAAIEAHIQ